LAEKEEKNLETPLNTEKGLEGGVYAGNDNHNLQKENVARFATSFIKIADEPSDEKFDEALFDASIKYYGKDVQKKFEEFAERAKCLTVNDVSANMVHPFTSSNPLKPVSEKLDEANGKQITGPQTNSKYREVSIEYGASKIIKEASEGIPSLVKRRHGSNVKVFPDDNNLPLEVSKGMSLEVLDIIKLVRDLPPEQIRAIRGIVKELVESPAKKINEMRDIIKGLLDLPDKVSKKTRSIINNVLQLTKIL